MKNQQKLASKQTQRTAKLSIKTMKNVTGGSDANLLDWWKKGG